MLRTRTLQDLALPALSLALLLVACGDSSSSGGAGQGGSAGGAALFCGDGFADPDLGEECDDANQEDGDDCRNDCTLPKCGDGVVHVGFEDCDDANTDNADDCVEGCVIASCGDGFIQAGIEDCDDGNEEDGDACSSTCTAGSGCGNGVVEAPEECDDGNTDNTDDCTDQCLSAFCGDGFAQIGFEECDDGNTVDNDTCSNACTNVMPVSYGCPGTAVTLDPGMDLTLGGNTADATPLYEGGAVCGAGSDGGVDSPEFVYAVTPSQAGLMTIEMIAINNDLDPVLYIKSGDCEAGTTVQCADATFTGGLESISFAVTAGTTYYVFADGYGTSSGEFLMSASLQTAVLNDDCPGANVPISAFNDPYAVSGDTSLANPDRIGTGACASSNTKEVVYKVTAFDNGKLIVSLDPSYDASLYVRTSCTTPASQIACSESGGSGTLELTNTPVTAGTTYYVFVDGHNGSAGPYNAEFTIIP